MKKVSTPECDKMLAVHEKSRAIGEFLDWLSNEGVHRMRWDNDAGGIDEGGWVPDGRPIEKLLAEYFDIDLQKVDEEKKAILAAIREVEQ